MNTQIAYETIRSWFVDPKHGFGFSFEQGACLYKKDANHRCAIGVLLSDKLYDERMDDPEGRWAVEHLLVRFANVREFFSNTNKDFLDKSQRIHDDAAYEFERSGELETEKNRMLDKLDDLARSFDLNVVTT